MGVGVVSGMPLGGGVESAARLAVRRPHPSPRSARRSAARGKFPPPGPPCGPASRPSALLHLLLPRAPSPSKARYGGPPRLAAARPRAAEGHRWSSTATGGSAGSTPGAGGWSGAEPPPLRGTRGPLGVSAAPAPASPPRRSPGTRPRKYFGLGHRTLPELCQRAARGEHGDLEGSRGPIKAGGLRGVVRGTMPGAWLSLLLAGGLALSARGDPAALLRRDNDASGRCTYSFTVASPGEVSCPEAGSVAQLREELAALAARLSRLEGAGGVGGSGPRGADVSGAWSRGPQRAAPGGCEELQRAKERLEEEKGRLEREKEELGRRLESSAQEIARLRAARCPSGTGGVPGRDALRSASKGQCWGMGIRGHPLLAPNPTPSPRYRVPLSPPPTLLPVPPPGVSAFAP